MSAGQRPLPFARLGYWYATCVGFVWGAMWSTGPVERHEGLWVFRGMPKWTFGRGGSCVGSCYLTDQNVRPAVLRHERVHREQWRRYGLAMPLLYALAGRDPLQNRFEIEAGLRDGGYIRGPVVRGTAETATRGTTGTATRGATGTATRGTTTSATRDAPADPPTLGA